MSRLGLTWVAALALGGCSTREAPSLVGPASLKRMASCEELSTRLQDTLLEQMVEGNYGYFRGVAEDAADAPASDGDGGATPTDYTTTNVQEEGVDEIDIIKMADEGRLMVIAEDKALQLVRTFPIADVGLVGSLPLSGWTQGLFVVGDKAIVTSSINPKGSGGGREGGGDEGESDDAWSNGWSVTRVQVVDISDPADPTVERTVDVQGWVADARMIDGEVFLVLNQYMDVYSAFYEDGREYPQLPEVPWNEDQEAYEAALEAAKVEARDILRPLVEDVFNDLDVKTLLPEWRMADSGPVSSMYDCTDIYVPQQYTSLAMLSVVQLDSKGTDPTSAGLMSDGWTVYASKDNLYVGQTSGWWWGWDGAGVTHIHKFALGGSEPLYVASGEISGWMYDQFAMSEFDGHLRAVTTDFWDWWGTPDGEEPEDPANNVFVLDDDGEGTLEVVGQVGGIAPGEQVRAVRMMGDKGYVVTFRQVDPLFTLDLSDPTAPAIAGELKIPGFSAYLHPLDEDHLIGVGMSGLDDGTLTGIGISVFDVSDPAKPTLAFQHDVSEPSEDGWNWSWSEALWDHHAFTFHRNVLTMPVSMEHYDDVNQQWDGFMGTVSFEVTADGGITELGRVDHADLVHQSECLYDRWYDWDVYGSCGWDQYWWGSAQVRRSAYVEDNLFTVSAYGVKVNDLYDPSVEHAKVLFYPSAN